MKKLDVSHVIKLHRILIDTTGGGGGIRDLALLESAVNVPFGSFDDEDFYTSIEMKAARLAFGIIKNHPFIDGNKRCGLLSMLVFLEINGINLRFMNDELIKIGLEIASDGKEELLLVFINNHKL